jgi:hypothetical protein
VQNGYRAAKITELVRRRRAVLVNQPGAGGLSLVAVAGWNLSNEVQRRLTVFGAPDRLDAWASHLPVTTNLVSAVAQARRPELLNSGDVLVVDGQGLTTSRDTTSWRSFAPVLRAAQYCIVYLRTDAWPGCLPLVELVHPFDQVVLMERPGKVGHA